MAPHDVRSTVLVQRTMQVETLARSQMRCDGPIIIAHNVLLSLGVAYRLLAQAIICALR